MIWHSHSVADVLRELQIEPTNGLSAQEVADRLTEYGENRPQKTSRPNLLNTFANKLRRPFTLLLLLVSFVVLVLDLYRQVLQDEPIQWYWPLIVLLVTLVTTIFDALRQQRVETLSDWMDGLSSPDTCVRRDGAEENISSLSLVPGDIVVLSAGDIVPADCRLITAEDLRCDESGLTNATYPVKKYADAIFDDITPLSQRTNMVYAGTTITAGRATAVVVATGSRSEWGHRPQQVEKPTAQKKVNALTTWWTAAAIAVGVIALIVGSTISDNLSAVWLTAAALITATAPSGLSAFYSLLTVSSTQRLLRRHVRILRPSVMNTLGQVTTITIAQDLLHQSEDATLCRAFTGKHTIDLTEDHPKAAGLLPLLRMTALNTTDHTPNGSSILSRLQSLSVDRKELLTDMPCVGELAPANGRTTTIHLADEQTLILCSGAWQSVLSLCTEHTEKWGAAATEMESDGLQVIAVAYRLCDCAPAVYTVEEIERDLTCVGLLGLDIPLCYDDFTVPDARTILFSNQNTAAAIAGAKSAGLTHTAEALTVDVLRAMDDHALTQAVGEYDVYCGLDTAEQCRVIDALQAQGHVVAATACHSKEAALLSAADVGMACGVDAANVVKAAADLILNDGDFATIRTAVTEGRRLWWKKIALFIYALICSAAMLFIALGGIFGIFPLSYCALLITCVHLLFLTAPTPLFLVSGAVALAQKLRK